MLMETPKSLFGKKPYFPGEQATLTSALMDIHRAVIVITPEDVIGFKMPFVSDERRRRLAYKYLCRAREKLNTVM